MLRIVWQQEDSGVWMSPPTFLAFSFGELRLPLRTGEIQSSNTEHGDKDSEKFNHSVSLRHSGLAKTESFAPRMGWFGGCQSSVGKGW